MLLLDVHWRDEIYDVIIPEEDLVFLTIVVFIHKRKTTHVNNQRWLFPSFFFFCLVQVIVNARHPIYQPSPKRTLTAECY